MVEESAPSTRSRSSRRKRSGISPGSVSRAATRCRTPMGGAEEQVALEPDHLDRLAVIGQQPALRRRPQHVARVPGSAAGRAHRIDPRVVEREHRQPGDDPDHDALDEAQPDQGQEHQQQDAAIGERQLGPAIEGQIRGDAQGQIDQHEAEQQLRHIGEKRAAEQQHRRADAGADQADQTAFGADVMRQKARAGRLVPWQAAAEPGQQIADARRLEFLVQIDVRASDDLQAARDHEQRDHRDQPEDHDLRQFAQHHGPVGLGERDEVGDRRPRLFRRRRRQEVSRRPQLRRGGAREPGDEPEDGDRRHEDDRRVQIMPTHQLQDQQTDGRERAGQPVR